MTKNAGLFEISIGPAVVSNRFIGFAKSWISFSGAVMHLIFPVFYANSIVSKVSWTSFWEGFTQTITWVRPALNALR